MATCRECKLFDIDAAKDKVGRVRKSRLAKCLWVSKEQYPNALYSFGRPTAGYTSSADGFGCKCFIKVGAK